MKKKLDRNIELSAWGITAILLLIFVPKKRIREAQIAFLFKHIITWLFGLLVVEKKLIIYPKRLFFSKAIKSSFTFEYFVYPALCALFNLYYPEKRPAYIKMLYYFFHTSVIAGFELFAVKYTNLIKYKKWTWYWSFITVWLTYYVSHLNHKWFYRNKESE